MNEIEKLAHKLKLSHIKSNYITSINEAMDKQASYEEFLKIILLLKLKQEKTTVLIAELELLGFHI